MDSLSLGNLFFLQTMYDISTTMSLRDADGNNVTDASDPRPWSLILESAADKGELLCQAQPKICKKRSEGE